MSFSVLVASAIIGMSSYGVEPPVRPTDSGFDAVSEQLDGRARDGETTVPSAGFVTPATPAPRLIVRGPYIFTPEGLPIRLRGWNWGSKHSAQPQDAADNVRQGATVVRLPLSWYYGSDGNTSCFGGQDSYDPSAPGFINPTSLAALDQQIEWASSAHLWIDVMVRGGDCDFWSNDKVKAQYIEMWKFLADRYKNTTYIASYSLLSEPHPPKGYTNDDVRDLYRRTIRGVRAIDGATPIVIGPGKNYDIRNLEQIYMPDQTNVAYAVNFYELPAYVKQGKKPAAMTGYPGMYRDQGNSKNSCLYPGRGQIVLMNRAFLGTLLGCATAFRAAHQVPVFIDQVGIRSVTPRGLKYTEDVLELFRVNHIGFNYWTYRQPYSSNSLLDGGAGVLWQDAARVYHTKPTWLSVITGYFQGR